MSRTFTIFLWVCAATILSSAWSQEPVNQDVLKIQDFEKRIAAYMKLRKDTLAQPARLKLTDSPAVIAQHEDTLSRGIREARGQAKQGDIFTSEIESEFRRLIGLATQDGGARRIQKSLKRAEPVTLRLRVNDSYPAGVPLQSTPPTLLLNLPALPKELEYRVVGHDLVIRDVEANLIIDFIPGAIP